MGQMMVRKAYIERWQATMLEALNRSHASLAATAASARMQVCSLSFCCHHCDCCLLAQTATGNR